LFCFWIYPLFGEPGLVKYKIILITKYPIILGICGVSFMLKTQGFQSILMKAKCKICNLEELFELHRAWFMEFERSLVCRDWNWIYNRVQGVNLQKDSLHQGCPYLHRQEALSVPSKALKPKKPRSSSCLLHRNHFSPHLSFKRRHHLAFASFERAIIISPGRWAVAALRWSGDWSALFSEPFQPL